MCSPNEVPHDPVYLPSFVTLASVGADISGEANVTPSGQIQRQEQTEMGYVFHPGRTETFLLSLK